VRDVGGNNERSGKLLPEYCPKDKLIPVGAHFAASASFCKVKYLVEFEAAAVLQEILKLSRTQPSIEVRAAMASGRYRFANFALGLSGLGGLRGASRCAGFMSVFLERAGSGA
jgi:hypothetical protein